MSEAAPPTDARGLVNPSAKRKRSPSLAPYQGGLAPQNKAPKTNNVSSQLQINYIARQCIDDLPFISKEATLPGMLETLSSYTQVLDRHESLASNLGARPLGPILIKRFERCFDAPPRVIASHSHARESDLPQVTWLDVVHFAQAHPSQFTLSTFSEGRRVCQFYYPQKQVRVQISEEDFLFINSGRCQDLIPPLPIWEDEEKEVATCELVEKALRDLTAAADSVAARTRQLAHRLKGRRMAILERRSTEESHNNQVQQQAVPPSFVSVNNTNQQPVVQQPQQQHPQSPEKLDPALHIRNDLLKHFQSLPKQVPQQPDNRRVSSIQQQPQSPPFQTPQNFNQHPRPTLESTPTSVSPVPTNVAAIAAAAAAQASHYVRDESPQSQPRHNFSKPLPPSQEVSQPYRTICQTHMESLPRGSRVMPPCDRCRRLKMDCLKNLSSCGGCTKKHARCHWKEVSREEVQGLDGFEEAERVANEYANGTRRFSAEYSASDTSMDVDTRSPFDYPSHTGASTPGGLGVQGFSRPQTAGYPEVQQQSSYPPPQAPQQQQGYEDPNNNNSTYRAPASAPRPFPEDLTQQQQQTQQQQDRTMDLLRVLGNHNNGITSSSPVPTNPTPAPVTDTNNNNQNRNNGAFRSSFTPANEVPAGASGHVGNATNGQGANIMTSEVPSATGEAQRV
ncbi:hypothetical protein E4T50_00144 [Aureobasidium sp. EXF-12298]|nr:hypothetical protein E4T50_00144 [Aureobasidium sp. EXF-12298]KAI4764378.1 hypothetical protein E4T51_02669 [Aureobasidium sp. EXF-12344]KAI4781648.1 hypothetical protein E4T52_03480 [Aureobasidium sp. EXF-3400]